MGSFTIDSLLANSKQSEFSQLDIYLEETLIWQNLKYN